MTKPNTSRTIRRPASLRSDRVRLQPGILFGFPSEQRSPSPESAPGVWLEIKGDAPTPEEIGKCELLRDETGRAVLLFSGQPCERWGTLFAWDLTDSSGGSSEWEVFWSQDASDQDDYHFYLQCDELDTNRSEIFCDAAMQKPMPIGVDCVIGWQEACAIRARAARFEHGERPMRPD